MKRVLTITIAFLLFLFLSVPIFAQKQKEKEITSDFAKIIQTLKDDGFLPDKPGKFYFADDFEDQMAEMGWYQWERVAEATFKNFVVRALITWDSASKTPQLVDAACGFVFRETNVDNHLKANIAMDGLVYLNGRDHGTWISVGKKVYGKHSLAGKAFFTVAAYGDEIAIFVDDILVAKFEGVFVNQSGNLDFVVASGTNYDFGTRCKWEGVELYLPD